MSPNLPKRLAVAVVGLFAAAAQAQPVPTPDPLVAPPSVDIPLPAGGAAPVSPLADPLISVPSVPTVPAGGAPVVTSDPILSPAPKRLDFFPTSLLWEPLLAVKRDPRTGFTFSNIDSFGLGKTADPSIGTTFGLFRFNRDGSPVVWQTDMFGVVQSRFIRNDILANTDYRAGVLETARVGNWAVKFGYEHTSTHIGDELLSENVGAKEIGYERDEAVIGLSYLYANQLRVYGVAAWSFYRKIGDFNGDTRPTPYRFDVGFDWYKRETTGWRGQPFTALNVGFDGATNYDATFTAQIGWMWKVADRRLSQFRVYAEFFDGPSPFGQTFNLRERYAAFGIALDY